MILADSWPIQRKEYKTDYVTVKDSAVVVGQLSYSFKTYSPQNLQSDWCCWNSAAISATTTLYLLQTLEDIIT